MKCDMCGKELKEEDYWVERGEKTLCVECARKVPEAAIDITGVELTIKPEITSMYYEENRLWMSIEAYGEFPLQETLEKLQVLIRDEFKPQHETIWHIRIEKLGSRKEPHPEYLLVDKDESKDRD